MNPLASVVTAGRSRLRAELAGLLAVRSLRWALLLMFLGGVFWIRQMWSKPAAEVSTIAATAKSASAPTAGEVTSPNRSPATFRLGAGYAGGFLLGFLFRRFLKVTSIVAALLLAAVAGLRSVGVLEVDWAAWEAQIRAGVDWSHHQAGVLKSVAEGYLPSTAATGWGLWRGLRRRTEKIAAPPA
jgi:uncharacterized membrane protein (Fun14 family)